MMPNSRMPAMTSVVMTGRLMNSSEIAHGALPGALAGARRSPCS